MCSALETEGGEFLKDHLLVHIEHLFSILAEGEESRGEQGNKPDGSPWVE